MAIADEIVRCKDGFLTETKKIPIAEIEMKEKGYGWGILKQVSRNGEVNMQIL